MKKAKHSLLLVALLTAFVLAIGSMGALGTAAFAEEETKTRYRLEFSNVLSNKIDGISYDVTFSQTGGGAFFTNAIASTNNLVMEAETIESNLKYTGGLYGFVRTNSIAYGQWLYLNNESAFYNAGDPTNNDVNMFQNGKKTVLRYEVGVGPTLTVGGEQKSTGVPVPGFPRTWEEVDANETKPMTYFAYATNEGTEYTANLTEFRWYDEATRQDLGINFSRDANGQGFDNTVLRYGNVGETITITPLRFGNSAVISDITAFDFDGEPVALEGVTTNADGTISFKMPASDVTIAPVYDYLGHYALNFEDDSMVCKLNNVSYLLAFSFSSTGWFTNKIGTDQDITISYRTEQVEHAVNLWGPVRAKETPNAWAYVDNAWFATVGDTLNRVGQETVVRYDTAAHAFSMTMGGQPVSYNQHGAGGTPCEEMDLAGAQKIGFAWNEGNYAASLSDFRIMDADGWDLGLEFFTETLSQSVFVLNRYAMPGETITLRLADQKASMKTLSLTDSDGNRLKSDVKDNGDGTWSFTMPEEAVSISAVYYEESYEDFYGSYYNAETGNLVILGEESFVVKNGEKQAVSVKLDSVGGLTFTYEDGTEEEAEAAVNSVTYGEKTYQKLRSYIVTFQLDGGTGEAEQQRVNSGDYLVKKPADPTKEGYTFEGWKTSDGKDFDFSKPVTESVTLVAQWKAVGGNNGGDDNPVKPDPDEGGCNSSVGVSSLLLCVSVLGAAAVLRKKREND